MTSAHSDRYQRGCNISLSKNSVLDWMTVASCERSTTSITILYVPHPLTVLQSPRILPVGAAFQGKNESHSYSFEHACRGQKAPALRFFWLGPCLLEITTTAMLNATRTPPVIRAICLDSSYERSAIDASEKATIDKVKIGTMNTRGIPEFRFLRAPSCSSPTCARLSGL